MERKEFLENARELIKGSIHEGYLYTEIQNLLEIIDKYNESMHILDLEFVPGYNDKRFINVIDTHQLLHGNFFIDKDKLFFSFKIDNYELKTEVNKLCEYYRKSIGFNQFEELEDTLEDNVIWENIPNQFKFTDENGAKFITVKHVDINQLTKNSENAINANINNYNFMTDKYEETNFEYNTAGIGNIAMSISTDVDNKTIRYLTKLIKKPNNNIMCVDNKAYGYCLMFGIEDYIKKLQEHKFTQLDCEEISYQQSKMLNKQSREKYTQIDIYNSEDFLK